MDPATNFEQQPATKRDMADVREDLTKVEGKLRKEIESAKNELRDEIKDGFEKMEKLLGGPQGLIPRVKRVEEKVGLWPNE